MADEITEVAPEQRPETQDVEDVAPLDPTKEAILQQLLDGRELRHSLDPAVSDFTGSAAPEDVMTILLAWQSQGVVSCWAPNDDYAEDGVRTKWRLTANGLIMCDEQGIVPTDQPPAAAPTITFLNPATAPANADVTVQITGTGFSGGATVGIGATTGLVPASISPSSISVLFGAADIAQAGTLPVTVQNSDGQTSNAQDFTVT